MKKFLYRLLCITPVLLNQPATAQQTLSLGEAWNRALEENHSLQVARNNSEIGKNNSNPGNAGLLPKLDAYSGVDYANSGENSPSGPLTTYTRTSAGVQISYTLFDGLNNIYTFKKLRNSGRIAGLQEKLAVEQTLIGVSQAYFEVAGSAENLSLSDETLQISRQRLERARNRNQFGRSNTLELLNAEVDFNTDSISFLNARLYADQARRNLNVLLNLSADQSFTVETTVEFAVLPEYQLLAGSVREKNSLYLLQKSTTLQAGYDQRIAWSKEMPKLNLSGAWSFSRQEADLAVGLKDPVKTLSAGLNLSLNLFNGFQNAVARQNSALQKKNQELLLKEAELNLDVQLMNSYEAYGNALYVLKAEQQNVDVADLNFRRTQELFSLGQVNTTQFREAQLNLVRAKSRLLSAKYSAKLNEIVLLQISGLLLNEAD